MSFVVGDQARNVEENSLFSWIISEAKVYILPRGNSSACRGNQALTTRGGSLVVVMDVHLRKDWRVNELGMAWGGDRGERTGGLGERKEGRS